MKFELQKIIGFGIFTILGILIFAPSIVFAGDSNDSIDVILLYVTENQSCSENQIQRTQNYQEATIQYIQQSNPDTEVYITSECIHGSKITKSSYPSMINNLRFTMPELLILVGGEDVTEHIINQQHSWGTWSCLSSSDDSCVSSLVIVCDCFHRDIENPQEGGVWTLSHELAHFLLFRENHPVEISGNAVHGLHSQYSQCVDNDTLSQCDKMYSSILIDDTEHHVMNIEHLVDNWNYFHQLDIENQNKVSQCEIRTCKDGLELAFKKSNDKAICLSESTAKILIDRNWAYKPDCPDEPVTYEPEFIPFIGVNNSEN